MVSLSSPLNLVLDLILQSVRLALPFHFSKHWTILFLVLNDHSISAYLPAPHEVYLSLDSNRNHCGSQGPLCFALFIYTHLDPPILQCYFTTYPRIIMHSSFIPISWPYPQTLIINAMDFSFSNKSHFYYLLSLFI